MRNFTAHLYSRETGSNLASEEFAVGRVFEIVVEYARISERIRGGMWQFSVIVGVS